jgi:hypothetical protein
MIVFGGLSENNTTHLNDTFSYEPQRLMFLYQRP